MEVICLQDTAFYALIEQVVDRLKHTYSEPQEKWLSDEQAMHMLNIKSKTTLQKLRDEGKLRFSQPQRKSYSMTANPLTNILKKMPEILSEYA